MAENAARAAWITGGAAVIAAVIGGLFGLLHLRLAPQIREPRLKGTAAATGTTLSDGRVVGQTEGRRRANAYDVETHLSTGQTYTDRETGLIVTLTQVETPVFRGPATAWLKYGLPENIVPLENVEFSAGDRRRFQYRGREYDFVLETIDATTKQVTIRVREY